MKLFTAFLTVLVLITACSMGPVLSEPLSATNGQASGPAIKVVVTMPPSWIQFRAFSPGALERLLIRFDLPPAELHIHFERVVSMETGYIAAGYRPLSQNPGQKADEIHIWLRGYTSDNTFKRCIDLLVHEFIHHIDEHAGTPHDYRRGGEHNAEFDRRAKSLGLAEIALGA